MIEKINSFVDNIIEQKKLRFLKSEVSFNEELFTTKVIKVDGDNISINNCTLIATEFINRYKDKFNFELSEKFTVNAEFITSLARDFNNNNYIEDFHILEIEIWRCIIKESNSRYNCSFLDYLNENKSNELNSFIEAYSSILQELKLTVDEVFENAVIQIEITNKDRTTYNMPLNSVLNGIKNKCLSNYDEGIELFNKSLCLNEEKDNLVSAIVAGLYENKRYEFYETNLKALIQNQIKINSISLGLSSVSEIQTTDCDLFIQLINEYEQDKSSVIAILTLVIVILK